MTTPEKIEIEFSSEIIQFNNVFKGIVSGEKLIEIYQEYGNSIFLDNIREFLGSESGKVNRGAGQFAVNHEISKTILENPEKFLERNNGIVIKSSKVTKLTKNKISIEKASIVNGCQTTMSLVMHKAKGCFVDVKIVQSEDSWDIAEAANFQNEINQLDLRLAKYIRPQEIRRSFEHN
jgi:hypothetical protein